MYFKGTPSTNANIKLVITDLAFDRNTPSFTCDYKERTLIAGSLHFYRMSQVCKIIKESDSTKTDKIGYGVFSNIHLKRYI